MRRTARNVFLSQSCLSPACMAWTLPTLTRSGSMIKRHAELRRTRETYWNEASPQSSSATIACAFLSASSRRSALRSSASSRPLKTKLSRSISMWHLLCSVFDTGTV
ncbi:hypothetical protein L1887_44868 [Cichorium endivia]|nr:hypothetical protein L1887_44868 [Cichorium endivia]